MIEKIEEIYSSFKNELNALSKQAEVLNLKAAILGKKGSLSEILKGLKDASPEERQKIGPVSNEIKKSIERDIIDKLKAIEFDEINEKLEKNRTDFSLRDSLRELGLQGGGLHPTHQIQREIEDVFLSMGFEVLDGPHIEDEYHNFEALNIPETHPARDMQDTFWFADKKHLLRTHTSTIQIRGMKERKPPFAFVGPGKVFRSERTDTTHEMAFHQLEGMMVGEKINTGHLIYFMKTLLKAIFKKDMEVRLRPGYFPFVEPGFELDIRWKKPDPKDESARHSGWLELLPCGMVHPNVLKAGGVDPEKYSGFAFGLGLDRLVMVNYAIEDIRLLHRGDLRFNKQFASFLRNNKVLISLDWIKDFTEVPNINIHDIANDFTMKTAEVEEVKKLNEHLKVIVVAEIVSLKKHPEADRLNLVTFNYGEKEFKEVVCGAPNLEVGQKVPYAKLGTTLPNGITLEPKKIRGYLSEGMLCSATELGLGEDSKGLLQLGKAAVVGQTMLEHLELNQDYLIDVDNKSLTHRPDLWGMYGIAREFAAIYHKPLKNPFDDKWKEKLEKNFTKDKSPISPKVESDSSCLSFWGLSVDGVQVGPSPKWIQDRLIAVGLRPINNIVDISNYVMMELGLPLHIYDRELIGDNTIHIKRLGQNDVFETLDEIKRDLISTDTVICDSQKPLVLAGIMGGANSGVRDETTKIFIEVANWKPEEVRRTSVRLGLRTDSSARYEKSLDSKMTYRTLLRTLELVKELCPEAYVVGKAEYDGLDLSKIPALQIQTSVQYINRILGTELERKEIVSILESLDFKVENSKNDELQIIVPSYRATKDIEGAHDIVEEIGRIIGYETIPVASPKLEVKPITLTAYKNVERKVQDYFSLHANSYEIMTYPLVGEKLLEKAHWSDLNNELVLVNALSQEADRMRPSLLPSLIEAASVNTKNFESFRFFEWGRTYHPTGDEKFFHEKNMVGVCFYSKEKSTFLELLNSVENFLNYVGINFKFQNFCSSKFKNDYIAEDWNGLHPYEKQEIIIRGKVKGALTTIHPLVCRDFKIKGNLSIALIDLTEFTSAEIKKSQSYTPLPKFPAASFDCTVLVEKNKPVASVFDIQKKLKIKDLESMKVVQVFSLNEEHNAVTIRFVYQDPSKTLEPAIIKGYEDKCVATLADFGYSLKV